MALTLTTIQYGIFAVSVAILLAMLTVGKMPERIAAAVLAALMFVAPFLAREGAAFLALGSGITLSVLVALTMRYERWWLIGAAGLQLVVFSTHFAPLLMPQANVWSAVTLRLVLWEALMALCLFALGECRWALYAKR